MSNPRGVLSRIVGCREGEEGGPFQKGRDHDHGGLYPACHLGLAGHAFQGGRPDLPETEAGADDGQGGAQAGPQAVARQGQVARGRGAGLGHDRHRQEEDGQDYQGQQSKRLHGCSRET